MPKRFYIILLLVSLGFTGLGQALTVFSTRNGKAYFLSDAPLELISATSRNLIGVLNTQDRRFSFSILVSTFEGFNSSLQQTHFNEDYLETDLYPQATFKGKIIEEVDLGVPGQYRIRAKGKLNIHGLDNDRIIRCDVSVEPGRIKVKAEFTVFLDTHDIKIPSIVNQKIAEEIHVQIEFDMQAAN
ncbi:MAG: YceI family protein [Bacteroidia bacterium]|nr:MAG: YceI family protein [Bacteroidia bacterium]